MDPKQLPVATNVTVFYHGGCPDGTVGAWCIFHRSSAATQRLVLEHWSSEQKSDSAAVDKKLPVFVGLSHGDPAPDPLLVRGRHVLYVDIVPPPAIALAVLALEPASVTLLDHHRSALKCLAQVKAECVERGIPHTAVYTEALSGAQIAWDWVETGAYESARTAPRPEFIDYVGDRDLFTFALPKSREINAALHAGGWTRRFELIDALYVCDTMGSPLSKNGLKLVDEGTTIVRYEDELVARFAGLAHPGVVAVLLPGADSPVEYRVRAVNMPVLVSDIGEKIMKSCDAASPTCPHFALIWSYNYEKDQITVSARTDRPDVDLSKIVPAIVGAVGGGGHPKAAGFVVPGDSISRVVRRG